jgi:hypothetical protein
MHTIYSDYNLPFFLLYDNYFLEAYMEKPPSKPSLL